MKNRFVMKQHVKVKFPSNIVLIKYWGKHGSHLSCNSSLSLTFSNTFTDTYVHFSKKTSKETEFFGILKG
jgi:mevalonate pyrophosphate decarboxylase